jgi:hypothetical protein
MTPEEVYLTPQIKHTEINRKLELFSAARGSFLFTYSQGLNRFTYAIDIKM